MREKEFLPLLNTRLGIETLNPMQRKMLGISSEKKDIILLSPTGSGKTVAFTLPLLKRLNPPSGRLQAAIIAPSRELAVQIAGVVNSLASDYKVTALYGGHKVEDEVNSLAAGTDIVVATPGRLLDHIKRRNIDVLPTRMVVLDEFDKSLELGFEEEMRKILFRMKNVSRYILTSATRADTLPDFLKLNSPVEVDFLDKGDVRERLDVKSVRSDSADKLESLLTLLRQIGGGEKPKRTIIFVNHRESAERTADFLKKKGVDVSLYHGALDQRDRETAIALFNSGSRPVLVATDLASRGLDIEHVEHVVHYHQPLTEETFIHRNGRTARVDATGDVYLLLGPDEEMKEFVNVDSELTLDPEADSPMRSGVATLYFSAGKREKLSRGDILGFITKECGVPPQEVGKINVYDHYALVAVGDKYAKTVIAKASSSKIKGQKRRVSLIQ